MTPISKARLFCKVAHEAARQKRKYTGEPYYHHPYAVAAQVQQVGLSDEAIQAAYLHDVVEDTGVSLELVIAEFGMDVGLLVKWLTDPDLPKGPGGMNRDARKAFVRERWRDAPADAKSVKLADLIDNTYSIVEHDRDFAVVYLKEKRALLDSLRGGHQGLWDKAYAVLEWGEKELNRPHFAAVSEVL